MIDFSFCFLYLVEASSLTRPPGHESHWLYIDRSRSFWHVLVAIATYNFLTVFFSIVFSDAKSVSIRSTRHIVSTLVALPFIFSIFMEDGHRIYVPYFLQSIALVSRVQQALNFYIDMGVSGKWLKQSWDQAGTAILTSCLHYRRSSNGSSKVEDDHLCHVHFDVGLLRHLVVPDCGV